MHRHSNISHWFHGTALFALIWIAVAPLGCASKPAPAFGGPVPQAIAPDRASAPSVPTNEKRFQLKVEMLQEEVTQLTRKVQASEQMYWGMMPAEWQVRVRAAKAEASQSAERIRYLEAMEALLARKLHSLQDEMKTYEAYQMSDPLVPRK
jgi:hypothetical protein